MTADELIKALQTLPVDARKLRVVSYAVGARLVDLQRPRISYRDKRGCETDTGAKQQRVIVLWPSAAIALKQRSLRT